MQVTIIPIVIGAFGTSHSDSSEKSSANADVKNSNNNNNMDAKKNNGCKNQFLIKNIMMDPNRKVSVQLGLTTKKKNTFDSVPHEWILKVLNI